MDDPMADPGLSGTLPVDHAHTAALATLRGLSRWNAGSLIDSWLLTLGDA